jgi:periplasmic protein TonB
MSFVYHDRMADNSKAGALALCATTALLMGLVAGFNFTYVKPPYHDLEVTNIPKPEITVIPKPIVKPDEPVKPIIPVFTPTPVDTHQEAYVEPVKPAIPTTDAAPKSHEEVVREIVRTKPMALGALAIPDDFYPAQSVRLGEQGLSRVVVQISADGHVQACSASGAPERLNSAACAYATRYWHFKPATADYKAVTGQFAAPVRWVLPTQ